MSSYELWFPRLQDEIQVRMDYILLHAAHRTQEPNDLYSRTGFGNDKSPSRMYVHLPDGSRFLRRSNNIFYASTLAHWTLRQSRLCVIVAGLARFLTYIGAARCADSRTAQRFVRASGSSKKMSLTIGFGE